MAVYTERSLEILGVFTKDMKIYKWYIEKYFYWLLTSTNTSLSILMENRFLGSHIYRVKCRNVSKSIIIRLFVRVFRILYKLTGKNSPEHHQGWRDYSIICIQGMDHVVVDAMMALGSWSSCWVRTALDYTTCNSITTHMSLLAALICPRIVISYLIPSQGQMYLNGITVLNKIYHFVKDFFIF